MRKACLPYVDRIVCPVHSSLHVSRFGGEPPSLSPSARVRSCVSDARGPPRVGRLSAPGGVRPAGRQEGRAVRAQVVQRVGGHGP